MPYNQVMMFNEPKSPIFTNQEEELEYNSSAYNTNIDNTEERQFIEEVNYPVADSELNDEKTQFAQVSQMELHHVVQYPFDINTFSADNTDRTSQFDVNSCCSKDKSVGRRMRKSRKDRKQSKNATSNHNGRCGVSRIVSREVSSFKQQLYYQLNPELNIQKVSMNHLNLDQLNQEPAEHLFKTCGNEEINIKVEGEEKEQEAETENRQKEDNQHIQQENICQDSVEETPYQKIPEA